ncbi:plasmid recombination protein [Devosia salina]|uniref:Plasmid recombination protein n=1 Tax=Devosia salina TaxID=2860336 RepID=A0ABX8WC22_9HYPH|nr:plasmid recombination protein [Devosia salina]QYO75099.1 plasmid recombination protein [Devosia salina]
MPNYVIMRVNRLQTKSDLDGGTRHGRREDTGTHFDPERTQFNEHYGAARVVGPVDWAEAVSHSAKRIGAVFRDRASRAAEFFVGASPEYFAPRAHEPHFNMERVRAFRDAVLAAFYERYGNRVVLARLDLDESSPHMTIVVLPVYEKKTRHKTQITVSYRKVFGGGDQTEARANLIRLQDWIAEKLAPIGLVRGVPKKLTGREHLSHHQYARRRRMEDEAREKARIAAEQYAKDLDVRLAEAEGKLIRLKKLEYVALANARKATELLLDGEKAMATASALIRAITESDPHGVAAAVANSHEPELEAWRKALGKLRKKLDAGPDGSNGS